jgi:hypothetical protein
MRDLSVGGVRSGHRQTFATILRKKNHFIFSERDEIP